MVNDKKSTEAKPKEKATEEKKPEKAKKTKEVKVSGKLGKIIGEIEKLSVIELADLVKALEDKFGVSAIAPSAAGGAVAPAATLAGTKEAEGAAPAGKSTFTVVLTAAGDNKIAAIKAVREVNQSLGLKEAKDLVESTPKEVLTKADKETAEEAKKKLEATGAKVELK